MLCSRKDFGEITNLNTDSVKNKLNDLLGVQIKQNSLLKKEKPKIAPKNFSILKTRNSSLLTKETNKKFNDINKSIDKKQEGFLLNLPFQLEKKFKSRNFNFTMMVVGESGLGKSTLINQLFNCDIYNQNNPGPSFKPCKTTQIDVNTIRLVENQVNLFLNLIDTPGFGEYLDNTNCCIEILDYVEKKFDEYLVDEIKYLSNKINDNRVHCCLYFIQPSGHRLKPLDIEFMSKLSEKINLVPIIAKADSLTQEELQNFKKNILEDITKNNIEIYDFPDYDQFDLNSTNEEAKTYKYYKSLLPFAIISSNYTCLDLNGKKKRLRKYPWGEIDVENLQYSDFIAMKKLIIKYHLLDMIEKTNKVFYEKYRTNKLELIGDCVTKNKSQFYQRTLTNTLMVFWNPLSQIEEEKKDNEERIEKMKEEMEIVFNEKVTKKVNHLEEVKAELKKHEDEMEQQLNEANEHLRKQKLQLEKERETFELIKKEIDLMKIDEDSVNHVSDGKDKKKRRLLF